MDWGHVISTLLGTLAGFLFAIALFYITEHVKRKHDREKILKGLRRELSYDLGLFDSWLKGIDTARPQVAVGDKNIFLHIGYTTVLRIFIQQAIPAGLLYDLLTDQELVELDTALRTCDSAAEKDYLDKLSAWRSGAMSNEDMFKTFEFHKHLVTRSRQALAAVSSKVSSRVPAVKTR